MVSSRNSTGRAGDGRDELARQLVLGVDGKRAVHEVVFLVGRVLVDQGDELGLEGGEYPPHLLGRHPLLEVVEEDVVRVVVRREALHVPQAQLEHALERGAEELEVGILSSLHPHPVRLGVRLRELGRQLGRDAPQLLEVVLRDPDQAGVVGVVR